MYHNDLVVEFLQMTTWQVSTKQSNS